MQAFRAAGLVGVSRERLKRKPRKPGNPGAELQRKARPEALRGARPPLDSSTATRPAECRFAYARCDRRVHCTDSRSTQWVAVTGAPIRAYLHHQRDQRSIELQVRAQPVQATFAAIPAFLVTAEG